MYIGRGGSHFLVFFSSWNHVWCLYVKSKHIGESLAVHVYILRAYIFDFVKYFALKYISPLPRYTDIYRHERRETSPSFSSLVYFCKYWLKAHSKKNNTSNILYEQKQNIYSLKEYICFFFDHPYTQISIYFRQLCCNILAIICTQADLNRVIRRDTMRK